MADATQSDADTGAEGAAGEVAVQAPGAGKLTGAAKAAAARAAAKGAARGGAKAPAKEPAGDDEPTARGAAASLCKQDDRAGGGMRRFKLRTTNYGSTSYRYVLATDRESAIAYHLDAEGLAELSDGAVVPQVYCVELAD